MRARLRLLEAPRRPAVRAVVLDAREPIAPDSAFERALPDRRERALRIGQRLRLFRQARRARLIGLGDEPLPAQEHVLLAAERPLRQWPNLALRLRPLPGSALEHVTDVAGSLGE